MMSAKLRILSEVTHLVRGGVWIWLLACHLSEFKMILKTDYVAFLHLHSQWKKSVLRLAPVSPFQLPPPTTLQWEYNFFIAIRELSSLFLK